MFTKIALSVAIVLGAASAALAENSRDENSYGGPVQTWQAIAQARQHIQSEIQRLYHTGNAGGAFAYVASPHQKHGPSHDRR